MNTSVMDELRAVASIFYMVHTFVKCKVFSVVLTNKYRENYFDVWFEMLEKKISWCRLYPTSVTSDLSFL